MNGVRSKDNDTKKKARVKGEFVAHSNRFAMKLFCRIVPLQRVFAEKQKGMHP